LEFGIWNLECATGNWNLEALVRIPNSEFQIPNCLVDAGSDVLITAEKGQRIVDVN